MTIYNTYRPQTFDNVIGQDHVVRTLSNAIARNIIGHAYLFTGPRGTGKTTLGRIFAHAVNCTPRKDFTPADTATCDEILAGAALDIIEIDAASHTSVDNIRDLRETVAMPPSRARYKVYIIDEAHMLSGAAWNAFLKTLEEPPAHAIFIFATTEVHKVPATILSRVQRFDLGHISVRDISAKLQTIATAEKLALDEESAQMIAIAARGSMRDAESLLAQIIAFTDRAITPQDVRSVLGIVERDSIFTLLEQIIRRDTIAALTLLNDIAAAGHNITIFTASLITTTRHIILASIDSDLLAQHAHIYSDTEQERITHMAQTDTQHLIAIADALQRAHAQIAQSVIAQLPLEIAIIRLTAQDDTTPKGPPVTVQDTTAATAQNATTTTTVPTIASLAQSWPDIIARVKSTHCAFAALLRHSAPHSITGDTLTLITTTPLLIEKIAIAPLRLTLQDTIATICGRSFTITVRLVDDVERSTSSTLLASTMQIMRGGHIIETA